MGCVENRSACCLLCAELLTGVLAAAYGCLRVYMQGARKSDGASGKCLQQIVLRVHYRRAARVLQNVPLVFKFETEAGDIGLGAGQISGKG
ncbi:hypothetical protein AQ943_25460 [Burkholderia pseudomallei]|nr:hypothetical protein AQ846_07300 [Burkholderia pseudomallei]OMR30839.1 hypothetical protein AQ720_00890 [Burkholderia pseudomallei]OMU81520.1 hypothetical protein AQ783_11685 [Burkholderia pseudomallei]OND89235.1 hypothetical protein AQ942_01200 [Burkholderia pseudomallei]OND99603.1 hypothetical protein AQ941_19600 [Burkholderia pseudomallei]